MTFTRRAWAAVLTMGPSIAHASDTTIVTQQDRTFVPGVISINKGSVIHFENTDEFIHQIYIASPDMTFESEEQDPGKVIDIPFPKAGSFMVRCHIHPKMLLRVDVH